MKIKTFKKAKVMPKKQIKAILKGKEICGNSGCLDACTCTGNCE